MLLQGRPQRLRGQQITVFGLGFHHDGRRSHQGHHFRIGRPIRGGNDDLVPLATRGKDPLIHALLGTVAHHDFVRWVVLDALAFFQVRRNGVSEVGRSRHGGVPRFAGLNRGDGCLQHRLGGQKVGFSDAQGRDGLARGLHFLDQRENLDRFAGLDGSDDWIQKVVAAAAAAAAGLCRHPQRRGSRDDIDLVGCKRKRQPGRVQQNEEVCAHHELFQIC
mmetsp:Transcript_20534/g.56962  ORF Transcript_20534/g.56962 Transcript_20534/m.56962 type:complete len:219 (+) Transcript_20534:764-1420(+)